MERFLDTASGRVPVVSARLSWRDRLGAALVRLGVGRGAYRVSPGLYALGQPDSQSPVMATANYKLTFDTLRQALGGVSAWILVLDTAGVNVWCAAGKKTFSTHELASKIHATGLDKVVEHRRVIVPQLGAVGVCAREVKGLCGFKVVFGPVRAHDLPEFLRRGLKAPPDMRRVRFDALDRVLVGLVEFFGERKTMAQLAAALVLLAGTGPDVFSASRAWLGLWTGFAAYLAGFVAGNVLTPLGLPWLPGRALSVKGLIPGALAGLVCLLMPVAWPARLGLWLGAVVSASWYAMQFTGSTTYTSPSGVEKEMRLAIGWQAAGLVLAVCFWRWGLGG